MEASLPISATLKPAKPRVPSMPLAGNASSVSLPLGFILMGLAALCIGAVWLVASPPLLSSYHYNPFAVAATHLFVLGWICSIVMGAMYQLVPVALETKLYSERLARVQMLCHAIGFAGMVWMFREWNMKQVGHFGSIMAVGVGIFVYNIVRTLLKVPRWTVIASAITAAVSWFSLTVTMGLSIAAAKCSSAAMEEGAASGPFSVIVQSIGTFMMRFDAISAMHAHAHLGGVGFFTMLIVGVSYKLIPMFTLSEIQCRRRAALSIALLNLGLAGAFVAILLRSQWKLAFAVVIVVGLALYGFELVAILRARKRRVLDWGIKTFLTAVGFLFPLSLLALVLSWPSLPLNGFTGQLENLYGFLALVGFISFALIGMLYKIIPFLVWFGAYSKKVGVSKVPTLAELCSERLQAIGYFTFLTGALAISTGILATNGVAIRIGAALFAGSLCALLLNVARMLAHFVRPQTEPLAATTPLAK
jgi:cbb3-type cytochrome oxidase subunit 1